jgi:hypothetical protein
VNRHGVMAYAVPMPPDDGRFWVPFQPPSYYGPSLPIMYGPPYPPRGPIPEPEPPFVPCPGPSMWPSGLSDDDRAMLKRIEEKLDRLLEKERPEAAQVEEIRRRVRKALDEALGEKVSTPAPSTTPTP